MTTPEDFPAVAEREVLVDVAHQKWIALTSAFPTEAEGQAAVNPPPECAYLGVWRTPVYGEFHLWSDGPPEWFEQLGYQQIVRVFKLHRRGSERTAPLWAHRLLDAFLTGRPLNFEHDAPPPDIQARLKAAWDAGALRLGPDPDPMPVFPIKGHDTLAVLAIERYFDLCRQAGLFNQAVQVRAAVNEMEAWQHRNPARVKTPDHKHVPATAGPHAAALAGEDGAPLDGMAAKAKELWFGAADDLVDRMVALIYQIRASNGDQVAADIEAALLRTDGAPL